MLQKGVELFLLSKSQKHKECCMSLCIRFVCMRGNRGIIIYVVQVDRYICCKGSGLELEYPKIQTFTNVTNKGV